MEVGGRLAVGSHNRKEFIVIHHAGDSGPRLLHQVSDQICQICNDDVGLTADNEHFVACNECGFTVCQTCYEYERREGSQVCPQCKTRYKRLKGCGRVAGDEEEDDIDDVDNEFDFIGVVDGNVAVPVPQIPLLTYEQMVDDIPPEHHALVASSVAEGGGKMIYSQSYLDDQNLPVQPRSMDPSKDLAAYGFGSVAWKNREQMEWQNDNNNRDLDDDGQILPVLDEGRQPLSRKLPISSGLINPYRMIIVIRLVVVCFFFHYRLTHPVIDAYGLWLTSVTCEIWFTVSWVLDQLPKWLPVERMTYLERLSLRHEKEGKPSELAPVDVFVTSVDPTREPPIVTANTVLSVLATDYPSDKVSCYFSDDGAAMLTFEALSETSEFAKKWVSFCKKFNVEPRAPEVYFLQKMDYLKDKVAPSFVKERRSMKRDYEEFKVRINALVAKSKRVPQEGWTMQDGTPWPGNNVRDHPGMIQVLLGQSGGHDMDRNELPRLVYVSREKKHGFNHHKKAGALNALVRASAVLSNAPYILNLDCNNYINNAKALREAMCFMMDPMLGKKVCYVQFPKRFDGIDRHDRYANRNVVFFDITMKGLDGIQGPLYVGSGSVFRRQSLYGYDAPHTKKSPTRTCKWLCCCHCCCRGWKKKKKGSKRGDNTPPPACDLHKTEEDVEGMENVNSATVSEEKLERRFGQSPLFVASTLIEHGGSIQTASASSLVKEAVHVISCGYEDKTEWGTEVGWMYGSVKEDILTGFKMHCRGWRSVYCNPSRPAFKGPALLNLSDRLDQVLRSGLGSVEIFLSKHCPIWYGYGGAGGLKWLERLSYINSTVCPWTSFPLLVYCALPAVCLLTGKFIIPELGKVGSLWFLSLFICIVTTGVLEMRWSGVRIDDWWRNEQFWVIGGVSAHLFSIFQGVFKVLTGVETNLVTATSKANDLYSFKWTALLIPPTTLLIVNIIGVVAGISTAVNNGFESWGLVLVRIFFAFWVIVHLYPFLKGLVGRQNRTPTIIIVWSILLASIFSLLWVRVNPFVPKYTGPVLVECGLDCK